MVLGIEAKLKLRGTTVRPGKTLKLLGITLDKTLSGKAHLKVIQDKVSTIIAALKTMAGSTWGSSLAGCLQLYKQAGIPALTYGAIAWFKPERVLPVGKVMARKIQTAQGKCLRAVAGAYKATSIEALEAELGIGPLDLQLGKCAAMAAARNAISEARKGTQRRVNLILSRQQRGRRRRNNKRQMSPLAKIVKHIEAVAASKLQLTKRTQEAREIERYDLLKRVKKALSRNYAEIWRTR